MSEPGRAVCTVSVTVSPASHKHTDWSLGEALSYRRVCVCVYVCVCVCGGGVSCAPVAQHQSASVAN